MVKAIGIIALLTIVATGCWDRVEVEERGFVVGVAVDAVENQDKRKLGDAESGQSKARHEFVLTYQFVAPGGLSGGAGKDGGSGGSGQGGGSGQAYFNRSVIGDSMQMISQSFAARTSRSPYFEHLKMIIVSEEVARGEGEFSHIMDFFLRNREMRRGIKIIVAKGKARDVLEVHSPNEKLPVMYINSIAANAEKNIHMLPELKIGDLHENLLKMEGFTVPVISAAGGEVKLAGAAVFRAQTNRLAGFLGEEDTAGLNFLTGKAQRGAIQIELNDHILIYDMINNKRKIEVKITDKHDIEFTVRIESEGALGETFDQPDFFNQANLEEVEREVEKELERIALSAIDQIQHKYKVDALGLGKYLKHEHYGLWKQIKDDWDTGANLFAGSRIHVETKAHIRRIGTVNKTEIRRD